MTRKTLCMALCALCASSTSAVAQSSVSITGLLDGSVGTFQAAGAERVSQVASGSMSTSWFGLRGSESLGGAVRASFALESFLRTDTGNSGRFTGDGFFTRNAFVGLHGDFGNVRLGRNTTPLFVSTLLFNAFGDSFGFSPSIRQQFTPSTGLAFFGDTGWNNSVAYASSPLGGLSLELLANAGEGAAGATGANLSAGARYFARPFAAAATWQRVRNGAFGTPAGWARQDTWQLGASYDFSWLKAFGQFSRVQTYAALKTGSDLWGLGVSVPLGSGSVLLQYGAADANLGASKVDNRTLSLGYNLLLSKRTDIYAVAMRDSLTAKTTGNSMALGMRTRF